MRKVPQTQPGCLARAPANCSGALVQRRITCAVLCRTSGGKLPEPTECCCFGGHGNRRAATCPKSRSAQRTRACSGTLLAGIASKLAWSCVCGTCSAWSGCVLTPLPMRNALREERKSPSPHAFPHAWLHRDGTDGSDMDAVAGGWASVTPLGLRSDLLFKVCEWEERGRLQVAGGPGVGGRLVGQGPASVCGRNKNKRAHTGQKTRGDLKGRERPAGRTPHLSQPPAPAIHADLHFWATCCPLYIMQHILPAPPSTPEPHSRWQQQCQQRRERDPGAACAWLSGGGGAGGGAGRGGAGFGGWRDRGH